ncbi:steroid oxidoreductase superfamily protein [Schizosaccharomyces cryophilus OY26]|uniref:Steroid oxidoreductase superfamily protein n=1 Tax=Schizosaccharomyces cryophilus (strain OY26 / ATCC MYA-4695 / CBS 11777 / NBRC 106824 / NRRL Y48691) TaxID=653667 RepID=S9WZ68_SCHCR|nr:steroid oxidoreductase superfamily protein [Schizosaccharomyces cryophilus OY26]EPY50002.1 steroid oxidoreductase superfamily protein [Schizosaccharomyces cryophilus OY26]
MTLISSLPTIYSASNSASWTMAVSPFLEQASNVKLLLSGNMGFREFYVETNPFVTGLILALMVGVFLWAVSVQTGNTSQVDRAWPILPTLFSVHFLLYGILFNIASRRLMIMVFLQLLWSIRLTYNYYRKGGYKRGAEDYRWLMVRNNIPSYLYPIVHFFYIHIFQVLHLYWLACPTYIAMLAANERPFGLLDCMALELFMFTFAVEILADQQQWDFYQARDLYRKNKELPPHLNFDLMTLAKGFNTSGLFKWSRHPNFLAEQIIWVVFYLFGAIASKTWINWTILGPLGLIAVFQGSTRLTETISSKKYPLYSLYSRKVGRFFPRLDGSHWELIDEDSSMKTE